MSSTVTITSRNQVQVVAVPVGIGVATGGTSGQVLVKASNANYDTEWVDATLSGGGAVDSVNGHAGTVVLTYTDVGADVAGAAAAVAASVTTETAARISADSSLTTAISTEASSRTSADSTLTTAISTEASTARAAEALRAPIASPTFTGTVVVPSGAALGTPATVNLTNGTALPESGVTNLTADLALKAPLASPTFTGHVTVPTPSTSTDAATKNYVDGLVATVPTFRGTIDASANPNYPSATGGDSYVVTVAGKVGGASGKTVVAGDVVLASASNAGGTEGSVGSSWTVLHSSAGNALTSNSLAQFAATTSAQLAGVISDETGTGNVVFSNSPTLVTPALGTPSALVLTNATGLPESGVTNLTTDLATKIAYGTTISWDGTSPRPGLVTDGIVYQDTAVLSTTAAYTLPVSTGCVDGQTIVISDRAGGATPSTPVAIIAGSGDTITDPILVFGPYTAVGIYTPFGSRQLKLDKASKVWTAVDAVADPDGTFSAPSDSTVPTTQATLTLVTDEIDALPDIAATGDGIVANLASGILTIDTTLDLALEDMMREQSLDQMGSARADVNLAGHRVLNAGTPLLTTDAATKSYVDGAVRYVDGTAAVTIAATDREIIFTGLTATRICTLPLATTVDPGTRIRIKDRSGLVQNDPSYTQVSITIAAFSGDAIAPNIFGTAFVVGPYGEAELIRNDPATEPTAADWTWNAPEDFHNKTTTLQVSSTGLFPTTSAVRQLDGYVEVLNGPYNMAQTDRHVVYKTISGAVRTVKLPASAGLWTGYEVTVSDASGTITPTAYIAVVPNTGQFISLGAGPATVQCSYGEVKFRWDGTNNWTQTQFEGTFNKSLDATFASPNNLTYPSTLATKTALDLKAPLASPTFTGTVKLGTATTHLVGFYGVTPVVQRAAAAQAAAPAGGTGATAGAYDTAAHRDALIALVNEMRTVLVNLGLMKGSA